MYLIPTLKIHEFPHPLTLYFYCVCSMIHVYSWHRQQLVSADDIVMYLLEAARSSQNFVIWTYENMLSSSVVLIIFVLENQPTSQRFGYIFTLRCIPLWLKNAIHFQNCVANWSKFSSVLHGDTVPDGKHWLLSFICVFSRL